ADRRSSGDEARAASGPAPPAAPDHPPPQRLTELRRPDPDRRPRPQGPDHPHRPTPAGARLPGPRRRRTGLDGQRHARAQPDRARPQDRRRRPERLRREARPPLPRRTVRGRDVLRMGPPRRRGGTQMTTTAAKRPIEELKTLAEAGDRELAGDPAGGVPESNPADV